MGKLILPLLMVLVMGTGADASLLGTYTRDYGNGPGEVDPGGNDLLFSDYVEVSDQSTGRFSDIFDFSDLGCVDVERFELELHFSNTDDKFLVFLEDWRVRPGNSSVLLDMNRVKNKTSQTFVFDDTVDTFSAMVAAHTFDLWFAEEALGANTFRLFDAKLEVYGSECPVPIPCGLLLLVSGTGFLAWMRRKSA